MFCCSLWALSLVSSFSRSAASIARNDWSRARVSSMMLRVRLSSPTNRIEQKITLDFNQISYERSHLPLGWLCRSRRVAVVSHSRNGFCRCDWTAHWSRKRISSMLTMCWRVVEVLSSLRTRASTWPSRSNDCACLSVWLDVNDRRDSKQLFMSDANLR